MKNRNNQELITMYEHFLENKNLSEKIEKRKKIQKEREEKKEKEKYEKRKKE